MAALLTICAVVYAVVFAGVTVGCLTSLARAPKVNAEELERASMRSSSWPSGYEEQETKR